MLLSAVSVLVVAQSSSKIPEGLINNPVFLQVLCSYPSDFCILRQKFLTNLTVAIHATCSARFKCIHPIATVLSRFTGQVHNVSTLTVNSCLDRRHVPNYRWALHSIRNPRKFSKEVLMTQKGNYFLYLLRRTHSKSEQERKM